MVGEDAACRRQYLKAQESAVFQRSFLKGYAEEKTDNFNVSVNRI